MTIKTLAPRSALDHVFLFEHLQVLCGRTRVAEVELWARSQGITYKYDGNGGVWTTLDAVNASLGIRAPDETATPYPVDTPV